MKIYKSILLLFLIVISAKTIFSNNKFEYSKAGFYELSNSGREVYNFNLGWRFIKSDIKEAYNQKFNDKNWEIVNCPHTVELISNNSSGGSNFQGVAWYRKHFNIPKALQNKNVSIHFEAIMGKCKVWLNGELVKEHFGGYLPFEIDITDKMLKTTNVISVMADNSDDPTFPPGKPQKTLDFSYFGGIYRDVWLVAKNNIFITNPNTEDKVAGGGVFVHFEKLSNKQTTVVVKTDLKNISNAKTNITLKLSLKDKNGNVVAKSENREIIVGEKSYTYKLNVKSPKLWSPNNPYLYNLEISVFRDNKIIDGLIKKIGIRKIEFKGKDGFWLNNKPYNGKLMGANRHQDHAYVGNALPNMGQWMDVKVLKDAGCNIIRAAHYPPDPAFMDACDQLGVFFIEATPGWQFWNNDKIFEKRVYSDIRNMVRRDRNHPSVLLWEPILNETWYPSYFAKKVHDIVHNEYPYQGAYTVCDHEARGQEHFDVIYTHPLKGGNVIVKELSVAEKIKEYNKRFEDEDRCTFTREWGDCVDDWNSHNSPSRVAREWGEHAQLVQVEHYQLPKFKHTSYENIYATPKQHFGGALWHSFDHQRGYHPDTFYGGITDDFRQPKYSYFFLKSQVNPKISKPMVYITNEMTPFSETDVTVFSNCDEVRLIVYETDTLIKKVKNPNFSMPYPYVKFKNVFNFIDIKRLHRTHKNKTASFIAEGLIDGKVVARYKKMPSTRASKIMLTIDNMGQTMVANGSDFVKVIASITDANGNVKRLNNYSIKFEVKGEGQIIDNGKIQANPKVIKWGTAPVLIRFTHKPGTITVKASLLNPGINKPLPTEITFKTVKSNSKFIYLESRKNGSQIHKVNTNSTDNSILKETILKLQSELNSYKLKEVEKQQSEFGIK